MSGMNGFPQFTSVREMKDFVEFIEEREKKAKEKDKEKKKDTWLGLTERELRWYLVFLSPVIGILTASVYLGIAFSFWKILKAMLG